MFRQIRLLSAVQLRGMFGVNEFFHTADKKKKYRALGLAAAWLLVILMMLFYMGGTAFSMIYLGMGDAVPTVLFFLAQMVILCFTMLKAGSVLFQMGTYELLASLPVSGTAIVVSRFFTMYVTNFFLGLAVMIPGVVVYGVMLHPGIHFFVYSVLGMILLPLAPITVATGIGAAITAVSARMRHKSLVSSGLTVIFVAAVVAGSMALSGNAENMTEEMLRDMTAVVTAQVGSLDPLAVWFQRAAVEGSAGAFLLLFCVSVLLFAALAAVLQRYFYSICAALNAASAKNNYQMRKLSQESMLKALWKREMRRYFASSIYVTNTVTGYVLMALAAVSVAFFGAEKVEEVMELPGVMTRAFPLMLGMIAGIMPTTACAVSMEGRQWWTVKSLPITGKSLFDSKILWNLTVAFPFYLVSVILGFAAFRPDAVQGLWIALIPAAYILFTAVLGITVNLAFPVFDWENEVRAVKQSASCMVTMLLGACASLPPMVIVFLVSPEQSNLVMGITLAALLLLTAVLYRRNNRKNLVDIG